MINWSILGIDPTDDVSAIKKAYAIKLKIYHPEDDPEGFQKLREAYESAIKQSRNSQKRHVQEPIQPKIPMNVPDVEHKYADTNQVDRPAPPPINLLDKFIDNTPSIEKEIDDFISQFQALYNHFFSRIDIDKWKLLLNSDVVWQVGYKQRLQVWMMDFLQTHYHLPKNVWQLLESNFRWREEKEYLEKRFPKPLISYIFKQLDQPGELRYCYFKEFDGVDYDSFLAYREQVFDALVINDLDRAGQCMIEAHAIYPNDPDLLRMQSEYYVRIGDADRALIAVNHAIRINPDDLDGYFYRAQISYDNDRMSSAIIDCKHILSHKPDDAYTLRLLAKCYLKLGEMNQAKEWFLQVLKRNTLDIEATTFLAQINSQLAAEWKKKPDKTGEQALKHIYAELGKPGWVETVKLFLLILSKRIWIYLVLLLIGFFYLSTAFAEDFGQTPGALARNYFNTVAIHSIEDLNHIHDQTIPVKAKLTKTKCLDLYADYTTDNNGKTKAIYPTFNEATGLDVNFGYVCLGYIGENAVIFTGNFDHWAKVLYEPSLFQVKGNLYELSSQDLPQAVMKLLKNDQMLAPYLEGLIVNKYIEAREQRLNVLSELSSKFYFYTVFILIFFVFMIREIRRTYRAVQF